VGGAIAPLIFAWLLSQPNATGLIILYIAIACTATLGGLLLGRVVAE